MLALAQEASVSFDLTDIQSIFRSTPVLACFAPRGKFTMVDLHRLGGTPLLLKHLLDAGLLKGDCMTVTGKTQAQNLAHVRKVPVGQELLTSVEEPFKPFADMQICFGNIAPGGVVFKVSSMQDPKFLGTAICFDDARDIVQAVESKQIKPGMVIVLRNLGPKACGMPEVLIASAALAVPELDG